MARKVLALVSEPVSAGALRSALGEDASEAEVMVIAPALDSRLHFWTSDNDEAIARADRAQEETVERLAAEDVDAKGDTGESDPLLALQDAMATFEADEIVIFTRAEGDQNWAAADLVEQAQAQFSVPVTEREVS